MKVRLLNILKKSGEWIRNHKYIFVTIVFLLIIMFIDENNMLSHMRNQETIKALTYEIQAMENDSAIVEAKNKLFTDGDTSVIEDAARERGLIRKNEDVVGYLFLGMGVEDNKEAKRELLTKALDISPTLNKKMIEKSILSMPSFPKEKLEAFAYMLPMIAEYIEANNLLADGDMTIGQLIKGYVKNNISKKITLSDISWHLHCSTVTLTEHFKKEFGITIMEYVMKKKMQRAEQLLLNSDMSIREVSEACGFPSIEYFSRSFKKHAGLSPYAWRSANAVQNKSKENK